MASEGEPHSPYLQIVLFQMEEKKKKSVRSDNWIRPDIVVKVVTKRLGDKYYKKKAVIRVSWHCEHDM